MKKLRRVSFTKEGYNKLKEDYKNLTEKRVEAVITLQQARELGDLSENGLYKAARSTLSSIDNRLGRIDILIKIAEVNDSIPNGVVGIGSKVILWDGKQKKELTVVGEYEADPLNKRISNISPIGSMLIGKKEGETIIVDTPSGRIVYKIEKIKNN